MLLGIGLIVGFALGLTGAGGSIVAVPLLMFALDMRPQDAMGASLGAVAVAAMIGALIRRREGNAPDWYAAVGLAITGMLFAPLGRWASQQVNEQLLLVLFALLASFLALRMWRGARIEHYQAVETRLPLGPLALPLAGVGVGLLAGFFGVGGGFLIVPLLRLYAGQGMERAISTSLLVIALVGSSGYLYHVMTRVDSESLSLSLLALGSVGGILVGTALCERLSGRSLQQGFAGFVLFIMAVVLVQSF